jgi:hypothetical protein
VELDDPNDGELSVSPLALYEDLPGIESGDNFEANSTVHCKDSSEEEELEDIKRKRATPSVSSSVRKRRCTSVYETAAESTANGMISLGASIKDAQLLPRKTRFDQAVEVLNEMKKDGSIVSKEYFGIVKAFNEQGKEHYSALFVGMTSDLRIEWLLEEELITRLH